MVHESCSVTFKNEFYVYGGYSGHDKGQISKVEGCQLRRISNLPFKFYYGGCTTVAENKIGDFYYFVT